MENKLLKDQELEKVTGGWVEGTPATITTCPCCGKMDTGAGFGIGSDGTKGLICCHNPNCRLQFEVNLKDSTLTGNYYVADRGKVDLEAYRDELIEKGLI